jgi:hypothetical protein
MIDSLSFFVCSSYEQTAMFQFRTFYFFVHNLNIKVPKRFNLPFWMGDFLFFDRHKWVYFLFFCVGEYFYTLFFLERILTVFFGPNDRNANID